MDPNSQDNSKNTTEQNSTPQVPQAPQPSGTPQAVSGTSKGGFLGKIKNIPKKTAIIIAVALIVLLGGSAAAYYGIVVPNKPQNVVKKVIENTLTMEKFSGKGSASFQSKSEGDAAGAGTVSYSLQGDNTKNASAGQIEVAIMGVKIPFEYKAVDKAFYLKVGDLSTVEALIAAEAGAESAAGIKQVIDKVTNKWIEFDESLLKSYTSDECGLLSGDNKLSDQDIDKMLELYDKNMFIDVKSKSKDTVDGKKVTKVELGLNEEKAKAFGKDLEQLEFVKKLNKCLGDDKSATDTAAEEFKGDASFTVWIDSGKNLVKFELKANDPEMSINADFTFNDDKVDIQKPEGATPAMQIIGELSPLLGGFLGGASSLGTDPGAASGGSTADQAKMLQCVEELQADPTATPSAECATLLGL